MHTHQSNNIHFLHIASTSKQDPHFLNAAAQLHPAPSTADDPSNLHSHPSDLAPVPNLQHTRILAHPSQDMWSIGAIFYLLLTGKF